MRKRTALLVLTVVGAALIFEADAQAHQHRHDHAEPETPPSPSAEPTADPHAGHGQTEPGTPVTPIPPITDADRAAAFPDVEPHAMGDTALHTFLLADQLEWQGDQAAGGMTWDAKGWIGGDLNRVWFRTEGETEEGRLGDAEAHLFYGRSFARWWDVVVGVRQNARPGPAQTWAAVGLQGLAPYWFEVELTGYVGDGGRTAARLEAEYELLLMNRMVLQPLVEANLYGKDDIERAIGAGLSDTESGLRLRYEVRREFAPYIGVTWRNTFGTTKDLAEAAGDATGGARFVAGLRLWY